MPHKCCSRTRAVGRVRHTRAIRPAYREETDYTNKFLIAIRIRLRVIPLDHVLLGSAAQGGC